MPNYMFTDCHDGMAIEKLGDCELADDEAAMALARRTVMQALRDCPRDYTGCSLRVTRDDQIVGGAPYIAQPLGPA